MSDMIFKFDPSLNPTGALQLVVLDCPKYGRQVIELDKTKLIAVPVGEEEWAKLSIDKKETIKLDPLGNCAPRGIFDYICYTITTEKKGTEKDPNCDYFITQSTPYRPTKKKSLKSTNTNNITNSNLRPASN